MYKRKVAHDEKEVTDGNNAVYVLALVTHNPGVSIRSISHTVLMLKRYKFLPYKVPFRQEIHGNNVQRRVYSIQHYRIISYGVSLQV